MQVGADAGLIRPVRGGDSVRGWENALKSMQSFGANGFRTVTPRRGSFGSRRCARVQGRLAGRNFQLDVVVHLGLFLDDKHDDRKARRAAIAERALADRKPVVPVGSRPTCLRRARTAGSTLLVRSMSPASAPSGPMRYSVNSPVPYRTSSLRMTIRLSGDQIANSSRRLAATPGLRR